MTDRSEHAAALDGLADAVAQRRREALAAMGPRPEGCPACSGWRLKEGEARGPDGHAPGCVLRILR